jgi:Cu+-exporting ATPase
VHLLGQTGGQGVLSEVLLEEKADIAEASARRIRRAFVGDGSMMPSLVKADVGIAIGSRMQVTTETGDIALIKDDPLDAAQPSSSAARSFQVK